MSIAGAELLPFGLRHFNYEVQSSMRWQFNRKCFDCCNVTSPKLMWPQLWAVALGWVQQQHGQLAC